MVSRYARWVQAQSELIALHVTLRLHSWALRRSAGIIYVQYNTMSVLYWQFTKQRNLPWVGWAHPCCRCDPDSLPMIYWLNCGYSVGRQSTKKKKTVQTKNTPHNQAQRRLPSRATSCSLWKCTKEERKETGSHPFRNWEVYEREQRFLDNTLQNVCGEIRVSIIVQLSQYF